MGELEEKELKKNLFEFNGLHKDKIGFVCGMGPSLKPYLNHLVKASSDKQSNVFISCNDFDLMTNINADYWVIANSVLTINNFYHRFNKKSNTTIVYAESVDMTDRDFVSKTLKINYVPYDQRHFGGMNCNDLVNSNLKSLGGYAPNGTCCKHIIKERRTIQETLMDITGYEKHYGTGNSVAVHMLSLAVILGLNPIYMCGVDLDYSKGYIDGKTFNPDSFDPWMDRIMDDFTIINESAKKIGIEIINLSQESILSKILTTKSESKWQ